MRFKLLIYLLVVPFVASAMRLDTVPGKPVYYESATNGLTRFYYDDYYFLADKNCQFKAIERVGRYDFQLQTFVGEFTDFNRHGRAILTGSYRNGDRHGDYKAYHPNGQLKWEVSYDRGAPAGLWKYYYPDGKPLLDVAYRDGGVFILNFWDQRGRQRVIDGNGRYEFAVESEGYNEFGYIRYIRKGRVADGRPHGTWAIEYVFADGKSEGAGYEYYRNGIFENGYELFKDERFSDGPRYRILPGDFFTRAEEMIGKACTIDEYSGFTGYLRKHLEEWFEGAVDTMLDPIKLEFTVVVKQNGEPGRVEMINTFSHRRYRDLLQEALSRVDFWFPSYADGAYIEDKLTVAVEVFPDLAERKLRFFDLDIRREKGI
ncbi:toxin-antitoxin system YwqK family antitoxin [Parapedobacter deserti]